jgi:O-antigen/teichoic acid export membrane protein
MSAPASVKSLSDRAGFLILANIIKFAIGIVMPMLLVRMLTPSDYGTYQQITLIGTSATALLILGLPTSVFYFYRHIPREQVPALVVQTSLMLLVSGLIATVAIYFAATPLANTMNNPPMAQLLAIGAVSVGLVIASEHSISFLIAQDRYQLAVAFEVGEAVLRVMLLLTPLWLGYGLYGLVVAGIVYALLRFLVREIFLFTRSGLQFANWRKSSFIGEQLTYSTPVAMIALVGMLGNTFNRGIVAATVTPAMYAVFAVGNVVFPFATIFQSSVANVLRAELPPLARDAKLDEMVRIVRESVRKLSIIMLPPFVFLLAHSYLFITTLFTHSYADSVGIFRIAVWELPLDTLILSAIPQVFGKTRINMYINFAATAVLLVASFTLIKAFGFYGAVIAGVGTQYVSSSLFFIVVLRLMQTTLPRLLPLVGMLKVVVASIVAALVSKLGAGITAWGLVNLVIAGLIFVAVFCVIAALLGVFTNDDRRLLRRWIAKFLPIGQHA